MSQTDDKQLPALAQASYDTMGMMKTIACNNQSLEDIKSLTSSKVTDQLKVFLVSQARNELVRVIKLTEFLDTLESKFMDKANEAMMEDSLTLKQYGDLISIITGLLARSHEIVSKVLKDDSLMTILNTTIYANDSGTTQVTSVSMLQDAQSRERVRSMLQTIIHAADNYRPTPEEDPMIVTVNETDNEGESDDGAS